MPTSPAVPTPTDPLNQFIIWLLFPYVDSTDPNIRYYYDFSQSRDEYSKVFTEMKVDWKWQPVTLNNFREVIDRIAVSANGKQPLVFNLCDGDEINGTPGISVIHYLEEKGLCHTGADTNFYHLTTSKATMKEAFDKAGVLTPKWEMILNKEQPVEGIFERLGCPLIVKPAISGGSMGISVRNVVHTEDELRQQIRLMYEGYHGWELTSGGLVVEEFIKGPEFTTLIVGSFNRPDDCKHFKPVERVFHSSIPETEKFLSFDRLWEFYETESAMPGKENFYEYFSARTDLIPALQQITFNAYAAVGGKGYARIDIRMSSETGELYVLEVNSQCGLSEDENHTSIGAILRLSGKSFKNLVTEIIQDSLRKKGINIILSGNTL
jgi:D-alanine-D-alanine ligase